MEIDLNKIYCRSPFGLEEYKGKPTFSSGQKECPKCNEKMNREPLNQGFIKNERGFFLVDIDSKTGTMFISHTEADAIWSCIGCNYAQRPKI